jgi:oligoendopeptidase F
VYANPTASPAERLATWKEMEAMYMPWRNTEGYPAAEEGRAWQFQRHIYESPFYYIDYALAQTCALQYWKWSEEDRKAAFASYLKICDIGGSQSFLSIVSSGGLVSPFQDGCLKGIVDYSFSWLTQHYPNYME